MLKPMIILEAFFWMGEQLIGLLDPLGQPRRMFPLVGGHGVGMVFRQELAIGLADLFQRCALPNPENRVRVL